MEYEGRIDLVDALRSPREEEVEELPSHEHPNAEYEPERRPDDSPTPARDAL